MTEIRCSTVLTGFQIILNQFNVCSREYIDSFDKYINVILCVVGALTWISGRAFELTAAMAWFIIRSVSSSSYLSRVDMKCVQRKQNIIRIKSKYRVKLMVVRFAMLENI